MFTANTGMCFTWFTEKGAGEGVQEKERRERMRGGRGQKRVLRVRKAWKGMGDLSNPGG